MPKRKSPPRKRTSNYFFLLLLIASLVGAFLLLFVFKPDRGTVDVKDLVSNACQTSSLSGEFLPSKNLAYFEGKKIRVPNTKVPKEEAKNNLAQVLGEVSGEKWIEVDLSEQKLIAWEGGQKFLETAVSTGLPWWPTPTGEFRIWTKFRYSGMEGGSGKYYYNLPNVPYVMFFENDKVPGWKGYGLHGTYWHNDFGTPRSHGCVNLPTPIAEKIFYWSGPTIEEGKKAMRASNENLGTRIVIHK